MNPPEAARNNRSKREATCCRCKAKRGRQRGSTPCRYRSSATTQDTQLKGGLDFGPLWTVLLVDPPRISKADRADECPAHHERSTGPTLKDCLAPSNVKPYGTICDSDDCVLSHPGSTSCKETRIETRSWPRHCTSMSRSIRSSLSLPANRVCGAKCMALRRRPSAAHSACLF